MKRKRQKENNNIDDNIQLNVKILKEDIYKLYYNFLDDKHTKVLFESSVQGIQKPYYKCRIEMYNKQIKKEDDIINYSCTCPVGYSCKHILQTLLKISKI
jgi:hypothetical protein